MDQKFLDGVLDLAKELDWMVLTDMVRAGAKCLDRMQSEQLDSLRLDVPPVILEKVKTYARSAYH
jgi:hypothetical protein